MYQGTGTFLAECFLRKDKSLFLRSSVNPERINLFPPQQMNIRRKIKTVLLNRAGTVSDFLVFDSVGLGSVRLFKIIGFLVLVWFGSVYRTFQLMTN